MEKTPTLKGEEAKEFINKVVKEQNNPNINRINLINEANEIEFNLSNSCNCMTKTINKKCGKCKKWKNTI